MNSTLRISSACSLALLALLASCSNSSGGGISKAVVVETEPNGTTATAHALRVGEIGGGTLADNTDTDFWKFTLSAGEVVSISVFGNRLDSAGWTASGNAAGIRLFDTNGISVLLEQSDEGFDWNDDQDTDILAFRAPADGTYFLAVDVASAPGTGGDYLVALEASSFEAPVQFELEAAAMSGDNDSDTTAEAIVPGTVLGFFVDDESDWYEFTIATESLVTFTIQAHRNGIWKGDDSIYDPELHLLDAGLNLLAENDDTYYLDSSIEYYLTTPGTYFIEVNECCGTGDSGYALEFQVEELADLTSVAEVEPNNVVGSAQAVQFGELLIGHVDSGDDDLFAMDCNAGDRVYVQVFDEDNFQDGTDSVTVTLEDGASALLPFAAGFDGPQLQRTILTTTGTFFARVSAGASTDYALRFFQIPASFETEPNDATPSAGTFDADDMVAGVIDVGSDADLFAFQGKAGVPVVFHCLAKGIGPNGFFEHGDFGSTLEPELSVKDAMGTVLATTDSTLGTSVGVKDGLPTVSLAFLPPTSGTFYVEVVDHGASFGDDFFYVLQKR